MDSHVRGLLFSPLTTTITSASVLYIAAADEEYAADHFEAALDYLDESIDEMHWAWLNPIKYVVDILGLATELSEDMSEARSDRTNAYNSAAKAFNHSQRSLHESWDRGNTSCDSAESLRRKDADNDNRDEECDNKGEGEEENYDPDPPEFDDEWDNDFDDPDTHVYVEEIEEL